MSKLYNLIYKSFKHMKPPRSQAERSLLYRQQVKTTQNQFLNGVLSILLAMKQSCKDKIRIIQVGANDGVTDDPIYHFLMEHKNSTCVMLIEPQEHLSKLLAHNYAEHPSVKIAPCAVGEPGELKLYKIRQDLERYYKGIIASGVTSTNKEYVENKAKTLLPKKVIRRRAAGDRNLIEQFTVPAMTVKQISNTFNFELPIDMLQIDAEGYDDVIIYQANLEYTRPTVINYEVIHLSPTRVAALQSYLESQGYRLFRWSDSDECAISSASMFSQ